MSQSFEALMSKLTPREQQICRVVIENPRLTIKGISQRVGEIKPATAKFHLENAYKKLNAANRAELVLNLTKAKT